MKTIGQLAIIDIKNLENGRPSEFYHHTIGTIVDDFKFIDTGDDALIGSVDLSHKGSLFREPIKVKIKTTGPDNSILDKELLKKGNLISAIFSVHKEIEGNWYVRCNKLEVESILNENTSSIFKKHRESRRITNYKFNREIEIKY